MHVIEQLVKLRKQGKNNREIAQELSLDIKRLQEKEFEIKSVLSRINPYNYSYKEISNFADNLGLSIFEAERILPDAFIQFSPANLPKLIRYEQIRNLISQGSSCAQEIAQRLNLNTASVKILSKDAGIKLPTPVETREYKPKEERIERMRELIQQGKNLSEIVEETGLKEDTIRDYARQNKISRGIFNLDRKSKFDSEEVIVQRVRDGLQNGINSLEELCKTVKVGRVRLSDLRKKYDIQLPADLKPYKTRPELDELIEQGMKLDEIGKIVGLTRERVRQYIFSSGQQNLWEQKKEEKKQLVTMGEQERISELNQIFCLLDGLTKQKAKESGWPYEKALEYVNGKEQFRENGYSFGNLVRFFKNYERAVKSGREASHRKLTTGTRIPYIGGAVKRLLQKVGLPSNVSGDKRKKRVITVLEKKEAIKRAAALPISYEDTAYFLKLPSYVVRGNLNRWGLNKKSHKSRPIKYFTKGQSEGNNCLTYRLASQVYEACDAGFNLEETCELLDTTEEIVDYTITNERRIAPKIEKALKVVYP